jgi:hypothetical protein
MGALDNLSSLASTAGDLGVPGAGLVGGFGKLLGGLFGKKTDVAQQSNDVNTCGDNNGITHQQASDIIACEERKVKDGFDQIARRAASDNVYFLSLLQKYNSDNPGSRVVVNSNGAAMYQQGISPGVAYSDVYQPGISPGVPIVVSQPRTMAVTVPSAIQQNLTTSDVKDLGTAVLQGAQTGATNWALQTPAGQQAKADGFQSWLKDNQLYVFAGALAVLALIYKAFFSKK